MGHQVGKRHRPRRGSLQFWPRKRAKREYPRVKNWPELEGVLGFAGYKVGMTHMIVIDNRKNSPTKGEEITIPITVLETPPLFVFGVKFYKETPYGTKTIGQIWGNNLPKNINRKINVPKQLKEQKWLEDFDNLTLLVSTNPTKKKKPEIFEIAIGGDKESKINIAKEKLGKEIKVNDVFREGEQVDVFAVTKGKGFQGPVKRFGVKLLQHKAEKDKRGIGSLGPWTPARTSWRVPRAGQMGYHVRCEYNKWILKIGNNPEEINIKGGFLNYGLIKGDYVILKGSVPGPVKRIIRLRKTIRPSSKIPSQIPEVKYISLSSKQGK